MTATSRDRGTDRPLYVVLGATGGVGRAVVAEAVARGHRVRAVSRSATAADLPAGVEPVAADLRTPAGAAAAVAGAGVVVHAAQPPYKRWPAEFPSLTRRIAPLTTRAFADLLAAEIDRPVRLRGSGARTLRLLGVAVPLLREVAGVAYQWEHPFIADDGAFRAAFPDAVSATPHPAAVAATVAWFRLRTGTPVTAGT